MAPIDYSQDKPEFVCIGYDHYIYGNKKEIEEYKAIRQRGIPASNKKIASMAPIRTNPAIAPFRHCL